MSADKAKPKTVLIVDDEESILEVVSLILSMEGFKVLTAKEGSLGLDMAKKHVPDAIILDIHMPRMNGYMFTTMLSQDDRLKDIPIMLLTGTAQMAGGVTLDVPGVHYKVSKPFSNDKLVDMLKKMLAA